MISNIHTHYLWALLHNRTVTACTYIITDTDRQHECAERLNVDDRRERAHQLVQHARQQQNCLRTIRRVSADYGGGIGQDTRPIEPHYLKTQWPRGFTSLALIMYACMYCMYI